MIQYFNNCFSFCIFTHHNLNNNTMKFIIIKIRVIIEISWVILNAYIQNPECRKNGQNKKSFFIVKLASYHII